MPLRIPHALSRRFGALTAAAAIAGALSVPHSAGAAPGAGTPDPSFGRGGFVVIPAPFPSSGVPTARFQSMRLLRDDTVQLAVFGCGVYCPGRELVRLAPSGRVREVVRQGYSAAGDDIPGLGTQGIVDRPDGASLLRAGGVGYLGVVGPDGSLLSEVTEPPRFAPLTIAPDGAVLGVVPGAGGGPYAPGGRPDLVRLSPDLNVDLAFGVGGRVALPTAFTLLGPASASASTVRVSGADQTGLLLARFTSTGAPVRVGRVAVIDGRRTDTVTPTQLVVRNGRALVVARVLSALPRSSPRTVVVAFRPDGRVDRGFGSHGLLSVTDDARIALQRDGRIVTAGTAPGRDATRPVLVLRRFSPGGRPDPTFRTRRMGPRPALVEVIGVTVDRSGRIAVAASTRNPSGYGPGGALVGRFLSGARGG